MGKTDVILKLKIVSPIEHDNIEYIMEEEQKPVLHDAIRLALFT